MLPAGSKYEIAATPKTATVHSAMRRHTLLLVQLFQLVSERGNATAPTKRPVRWPPVSTVGSNAGMASAKKSSDAFKIGRGVVEADVDHPGAKNAHHSRRRANGDVRGDGEGGHGTPVYHAEEKELDKVQFACPHLSICCVP